MNNDTRDLNLLRVFQVLYEERNASRAAQRMSLSQPALSHKLNKLRREWRDPLFVRAPRGLTPTPRAHALAARVQRLLLEVESLHQHLEADDFLAQEQRLHAYTTDYMEQTLLPVLLPRLRALAPRVTLVSHATRGTLPRRELEQGTCDVAIAGFFDDLPDTLRQQRLLSEDFVVLAWRHHPLLSGTLDLPTYLACEHLLTTLNGDLHGLVDRALARQGLQRRVVAGLSSFIAPTRLVRGSPWLLTCLRSVGTAAAALDADLQLHELPLDLARVEVMQIWHERTDADPLRRWLRQQIHAAARDLVLEPPGAPGLPA